MQHVLTSEKLDKIHAKIKKFPRKSMEWYAFQTSVAVSLPQNKMELLHLHLCEAIAVHKQKNTECDAKP